MLLKQEMLMQRHVQHVLETVGKVSLVSLQVALLCRVPRYPVEVCIMERTANEGESWMEEVD